MSREAHTPGPWAVLPEECDKPYIRVRGRALGYRYKVANVLTPIYDGVPSKEAEETRANARLIASAPELLKATQAAWNCISELNPTQARAEVVQMLQAAIEQAIGEEP